MMVYEIKELIPDDVSLVVCNEIYNHNFYLYDSSASLNDYQEEIWDSLESCEVISFQPEDANQITVFISEEYLDFDIQDSEEGHINFYDMLKDPIPEQKDLFDLLGFRQIE